MQAVKYRLHPANQSGDLHALYSRFQTEVSPAARQQIAREISAKELSLSTSEYDGIMAELDQKVAEVRLMLFSQQIQLAARPTWRFIRLLLAVPLSLLQLIWGAGLPPKNARSSRAADHTKAFSRDAGKLLPGLEEIAKPLPKDEHGNVLDGDLGVTGAFKDLNVVVIQQYSGEGFDFRYPRAALEV